MTARQTDRVRPPEGQTPRPGRRTRREALVGLLGAALTASCDFSPLTAPTPLPMPAPSPGASPATAPAAAGMPPVPAVVSPGPAVSPPGAPLPGPIATTVQIVSASPGPPSPPGPPLVVPGRSPSPLASPAARSSPSPVPLVLHRPGLLAVEREGRILLVDPDGGRAPRILVDGPDNRRPRWSPDGGAVLILAGAGAAGELRIVQTDGQSPRRLTSNRLPERGATWSPRGDLVAYAVPRQLGPAGEADPREPEEIWIVETRSGRERKLVDGLDPAWSPDGRVLAYATNGQRDEHGPRLNAVRVVGVDGAGDRPVLAVADLPPDLLPVAGAPFKPATARLRWPAWSPDGLQLVASAEGHTSMAVTFDAQGQGLRAWALAYEGGVGRACWSPDGARLAVESRPATGVDVVAIVEPATGREIRLGGPARGFSATDPAWAPDGRRLALIAGSLPGRLGVPQATALRLFTPDGEDLGQLVAEPDLRAPDWGRAP